MTLPALCKTSCTHLLCNRQGGRCSSKKAQRLARIVRFLAIDASMEQGLGKLDCQMAFVSSMAVCQMATELRAEGQQQAVIFCLSGKAPAQGLCPQMLEKA